MNARRDLGSFAPPGATTAGVEAWPAADAAVFASEYRGLQALILRRVRDPQVAADILQDAIVTTLVKLRSGEIARPEAIGGYIYRVALNHLRNHRRKDRSPDSSPDAIERLEDPAAEAAVESSFGTQWSRIVAEILDELPTPRDREILVRFYLDDEAKDSICASLRLSGAHFHRVVFRARARFRELIERRGFQRLDLLSLAGLASSLLLLTFGAAHTPADPPARASDAAPAAAGRFIPAGRA